MIVQEGDSPKKTKEKWVHEAIEQYRGGRYEETLASCEQALRLKNNYSRAHHGKGLALMGLEHYEEAVTSLEQAIRLSRQDGVDLDHLAKMYVDQGRALCAMNRYKEALRVYQEAVRLVPADKKIQAEKDTVLFELGKAYEQAEAQKARERAEARKAQRESNWLCEEPFRYE